MSYNIKKLNELIQEASDKTLISDGYKTFGELYLERANLFILGLVLLGKVLKSTVGSSGIWYSSKTNAGVEVEGFFYAGAGDSYGMELPNSFLSIILSLEGKELAKAKKYVEIKTMIERIKTEFN